MKTLLLLLLSLPVLAQLPASVAFPVFRGNTETRTIVLDATDSLATVSDTAYYEPAGRKLVAALQPTLTRTGRIVTFTFTPAQTLGLPDISRIEVRIAGNVRIVYRVVASRSPLTTSPPLTLTVVNSNQPVKP